MEGKQIVGAVVETVAKVVIAAVVLMFIYRYSIMAYDYGYRIFGEEAVDAEPDAGTKGIDQGCHIVCDTRKTGWSGKWNSPRHLQSEHGHDCRGNDGNHGNGKQGNRVGGMI